MALLLRYWPHLLALALAFGAGWHVGHAPGAAKAAKAERALALQQRDAVQRVALAQESARTEERRNVEALAKVVAKQQQDLADAKLRETDLSGKLASGERRLRHEIAALYTAGLSRESAAANQPDPAAQRGAELVAAAIGIGAACDARQAAWTQWANALNPGD